MTTWQNAYQNIDTPKIISEPRRFISIPFTAFSTIESFGQTVDVVRGPATVFDNDKPIATIPYHCVAMMPRSMQGEAQPTVVVLVPQVDLHMQFIANMMADGSYPTIKRATYDSRDAIHGVHITPMIFIHNMQDLMKDGGFAIIKGLTEVQVNVMAETGSTLANRVEAHAAAEREQLIKNGYIERYGDKAFVQPEWNRASLSQEMNDIIGKTPVHVRQNEDEIVIWFDDESVCKFVQDSTSCAEVIISDVNGDWSDLIGTPLLVADERSYHREACSESDSETWTFYTFRSVKGSVDVRWYGSSNGYYSEEVCFWLWTPSRNF